MGGAVHDDEGPLLRQLGNLELHVHLADGDLRGHRRGGGPTWHRIVVFGTPPTKKLPWSQINSGLLRKPASALEPARASSTAADKQYGRILIRDLGAATAIGWSREEVTARCGYGTGSSPTPSRRNWGDEGENPARDQPRCAERRCSVAHLGRTKTAWCGYGTGSSRRRAAGVARAEWRSSPVLR